MYKNNFFITEEEKKHILNLTRLPNYKKPIRLKEQEYSAVITDEPVKQQEKKVSTDSLVELLQQMNWPYRENGKIKMPTKLNIMQMGDYLMKKMEEGFRGPIFQYYVELLDQAAKIDPNNSSDYSSKKGNYGKKYESVKSKFQAEASDLEYDPYTNPSAQKQNAHKWTEIGSPREPGGSFFGSLQAYKYTPRTSAEVLQSGIMDFNECVNLYRLMSDPAKSGWNNATYGEKDTFKKNLEACYNSHESKSKKNLFGKTNVKYEKSPYDMLSRNEKKNFIEFAQNQNIEGLKDLKL